MHDRLPARTGKARCQRTFNYTGQQAKRRLDFFRWHFGIPQQQPAPHAGRLKAIITEWPHHNAAIKCVTIHAGLFFAPYGLTSSYSGLILAHAALGTPFVVTTVMASLAGFDQNLVRAAYSLGAHPLKSFFTVTLPIIAPGVIAGALFAFATSFDEVVVTLFLAGPEQVTLPREMFSGIRENISPIIAAVATILIVFSTCLLLTLEWLRGRSQAAATAKDRE